MQTQRTLDRAITACQNCRRRKVRCNRAQPRCANCAEKNDECVYINRSGGPREYTFIQETPGTAVPDAETFDTLAIPADVVDDIEDRISALGATLGQLHDRPVRHEAAEQTNDLAAGHAADTELMQSAKNDATNNNALSRGTLLKHAGGRMRYIERSYWAHLWHEIADIEDLLASQTRFGSAQPLNTTNFTMQRDALPSWQTSAEPSPYRSQAGSVSSSFVPSDHSLKPHFNGDIASQAPAFVAGTRQSTPTIVMDNSFLTQLPPIYICDQLIESFINYYHPLVPLTHVPTFKERSAELWRYYHDPRSVVSGIVGFTAFYVAALFAGSVTCPEAVSWPDETANGSNRTSTYLHTLGLKALRLAGFPRSATVDTLAAYLLLQGTWMREEEPLTCTAFVGLSFRIATLLGLHRDPRDLHITDNIEAEIRRRIWWHLVHVDALIAVAAGLPPLIDLSISNVSAISELSEGQLGSPLSAFPSQEQYDAARSTLGILVAGKLESSVILRRAWTTLADPFREVPNVVTRLQSLNDESRTKMEQRVDTLNEKRARYLEADFVADYENNTSLLDRARLQLSAFADRQICTIGPGMAQAASEMGRPDLKPRTSRSAQLFMVRFLQIAVSKEFVFYSWSWPGNHQPLHALIILLIDIIKSPQGNLDLLSVELVEIAFGLSESEGGIVSSGIKGLYTRPLTEGGSETWTFLRRLRARGWQKQGMDPQVIWPRSKAIEAGQHLLDQESFIQEMREGDSGRQGQHFATTEPAHGTFGRVGEDLDYLLDDPGNILGGFPGFDQYPWHG